jgi:hypothetical protein
MLAEPHQSLASRGTDPSETINAVGCRRQPMIPATQASVR